MNISSVKFTMLLVVWDQEISQQASQSKTEFIMTTELSDLKMISYCFDMFRCAIEKERELVKLLISLSFI